MAKKLQEKQDPCEIPADGIDKFTWKAGDVFVHGPGERWVGPFQFRDYLGNWKMRPVPMIAGAYVITRNAWEENPFHAEPLYIGMSSRLLLRIGQL